MVAISINYGLLRWRRIKRLVTLLAVLVFLFFYFQRFEQWEPYAVPSAEQSASTIDWSSLLQQPTPADIQMMQSKNASDRVFWWRRFAQLLDIVVSDNARVRANDKLTRRQRRARQLLASLEAILFPWLPQPKFSKKSTSLSGRTTAQSLIASNSQPMMMVQKAAGQPLFNRRHLLVDRAILIGTADSFAHLTLVNIRSIRENLQSSMEIHLFFIDDKDLSPANQALLRNASYGVRLFPLNRLLGHQAMSRLQPQGFSVKPLALLFGRCRECILMDADSFMIVPPEYFFDNIEEYQRTGALFFHDRQLAAASTVSRDWFLSVTRSVRTENGFLLSTEYEPFKLYLTGHKGEMQESGLIVLDRRRPKTIAALLVATEMNCWPIRADFYPHVYGDKESYWISMEIVRAPYSFNGKYAGNIGTVDRYLWSGWWGVCSGTMVHLVRSQPRQLLWFNGGLFRLKYHPEVPGWNETVRWEAWTVDGPWLLDLDGYCMRSQFGGLFQWVPGMRSILGTHLRRIQPADRKILDGILAIDNDIKQLYN